MLRLIYGPAGCGKTRFLMEKIRQRAEKGLASVYLVPEQSSQAAEVRCFDALGDALSRFCTPLSFRTLSQHIDAACGGMAAPELTDAGRCVFVRRAVDSLGDQVRYYRRHKHATAFLTECAGLVQQLKQAGADAQSLFRLTEQGEAGEKLKELALIYTAYEAAVSGAAVDQEDRLFASAARLDDSLFAQTAFFVDDFNSFTAPEYELLRRLLCVSADMTVAFRCDGLHQNGDELDLFAPVQKAAVRLERMAKAEQVPVAVPVGLSMCENRPRGLMAAEAILRGQKLSQTESDGLFYTPAPDRRSECEQVAVRIRHLAQAGEDYSKMAVICRDLSAYQDLLEEVFSLYDIPFYCDSTDTVEHTAPAAALFAALSLASGGLCSRSLLALLKTGLFPVSLQELTALENYAYVWQPTAAQWRSPFTYNPSGLGQMEEEDTEILAAAERLRSWLVPKAEAFLERSRRTDGARLSRALYLFLSELGCPNAVESLCSQLAEQGEIIQAENTLRSWDLAMQALDSMATLLGNDPVTPAEYAELLQLLLRADKVGQAPQSQGAVVLAQADRMRLSGVQHAFVVGLCEGDFPLSAAPAELLTRQEREFLAQGGIEMPGGFEELALREQLCLYRALTSAEKELYLSWPYQAAGENKTVCAVVGYLAERLSPPACPINDEDRYGCAKAALAGLAAQYGQDTPLTASLSKALRQAGWQSACEQLEKAACPASFAVEDTGAMKQLLGNRLTLSPSRVESFYKCSYAYFLQYVLRLRPRRKVELSPAESGSFVHFILEQALCRCKDEFVTKTDQELMALAGELAQEYLREKFPPEAACGSRFGYLIERISQNAGRLLIFMRKEQAQSDFHPVAFELSVGEGQEVPPLRLVSPDGILIQVRGTVDRVDVMHREEKTYLRVVDYKTGAKEFALDEVYCGLDLQMLFYLFSLCEAPAGRFAGAQPAGVLYLLADPAPPQLSREQAQNWQPVYQVDGLVLDDEMVLRAMDKEGAGVFIPVSRTSTGKLRRSTKLADLAKLGRIRERLDELMIQLADQLYKGQVDAAPLVHGQSPCSFCDWRTVCRHEDGRRERAVTVKKDVFDNQPQEVKE